MRRPQGSVPVLDTHTLCHRCGKDTPSTTHDSTNLHVFRHLNSFRRKDGRLRGNVAPALVGLLFFPVPHTRGGFSAAFGHSLPRDRALREGRTYVCSLRFVRLGLLLILQHPVWQRLPVNPEA